MRHDVRVSARERPQVHFTVERGWLNDPCGVVWHEGEYHLFFQYVPDSTQWVPECRWGRATSPDLVAWRFRGSALIPDVNEVGCWSGTAVVADGEVQLFYTRAVDGRLPLGDVVRARPAVDGRWRADPSEPVVRPPDEGVRDFRDPCVLRVDDGWVMVVGASLGDGVAAVIGYSSTDLVGWESTGVVCRRSATEVAPIWTGSLWECPHLFRLGDDWALLVSVWHDGMLVGVAAATGRFERGRFEPAHWQQLTVGDSAYAMASFEDHDGRRCVIAWLRERGDTGAGDSSWAGALSLPYVVSLDADGALALQLHPDVLAARRRMVPLEDACRLTSFEVVFDGADEHAVVGVRAGSTVLFSAAARRVRSLVVDADIVEVSTGDALTAVRVPRGESVRIGIDGHIEAVTCWELSAKV